MKRYLIINIIITILNFAPEYSFGQDSLVVKQREINDLELSECGVDKSYLKSYLTDFKALIISPAKWDKKDWIIAGTTTGMAGFLYFQDENNAAFLQKNRTDGLDLVNEYFYDPFGKMYYTVPFMGAMYLYGAIYERQKPKAVAMDFVKASVYSGIIITAIKHLTHRQRPFQTTPLDNSLWDGPFTDDWAHTSFPSGHTIMSFTFASVLAEHYSDKIWIPITVYTLATTSGLARMYANKHWTSDVLIGATLGYAIGKFVVKNGYCKSKLSVSTTSTGFGIRYQL